VPRGRWANKRSERRSAVNLAHSSERVEVHASSISSPLVLRTSRRWDISRFREGFRSRLRKTLS